MRHVVYCDLGGTLAAHSGGQLGQSGSVASYAPRLAPPDGWPPSWLGEDGSLVAVVVRAETSAAMLCATLRSLAASIERGNMPAPNVADVRAWEITYSGAASI